VHAPAITAQICKQLSLIMPDCAPAFLELERCRSWQRAAALNIRLRSKSDWLPRLFDFKKRQRKRRPAWLVNCC